MNRLGWFSILLMFASTFARAYYDPYGYNPYSSYSRYRTPERGQIISLDFDQKDILNSSFRIAAREDRLTDLQTAFLQGADMNSVDDEGETALMYTARNCTTSTASFLIHRGANPNIQDKLGRTALMYAAMESCLPVVRMLLRRSNTAVYLEDESHRTALNYAEDAASLDVDGPSVVIVHLLRSPRSLHHERSSIQAARVH